MKIEELELTCEAGITDYNSRIPRIGYCGQPAVYIIRAKSTDIGKGPVCKECAKAMLDSGRYIIDEVIK